LSNAFPPVSTCVAFLAFDHCQSVTEDWTSYLLKVRVHVPPENNCNYKKCWEPFSIPLTLTTCNDCFTIKTRKFPPHNFIAIPQNIEYAIHCILKTN